MVSTGSLLGIAFNLVVSLAAPRAERLMPGFALARRTG